MNKDTDEASRLTRGYRLVLIFLSKRQIEIWWKERFEDIWNDVSETISYAVYNNVTNGVG